MGLSCLLLIGAGLFVRTLDNLRSVSRGVRTENVVTFGVTPGSFDALGIPVKAGRDLTWRDWGSGRKRCLVNEALVRIGVFGDAKYEDVRGAVPRQIFISMDSHTVERLGRQRVRPD